MATDQDFIDYVAEQAGLGERLTRRKMFGEYAFYVDGKVVAFACDNSLFFKPSSAAKKLAPRPAAAAAVSRREGLPGGR